jgi:spermidine/putrescine transport system ATP-binding protein
VAENGGVRLGSGELCPADVPEDCNQGEQVQLSVRPEKVWTEKPEEGMVSIEGTIAERVYVGTSTQVIVELADGVRLIALDQNFNRAKSDDRWEIGDRLQVSWHPEHSLVLR